jgi:hypothetical protein
MEAFKSVTDLAQRAGAAGSTDVAQSQGSWGDEGERIMRAARVEPDARILGKVTSPGVDQGNLGSPLAGGEFYTPEDRQRLETGANTGSVLDGDGVKVYGSPTTGGNLPTGAVPNFTPPASGAHADTSIQAGKQGHVVFDGVPDVITHRQILDRCLNAGTQGTAADEPGGELFANGERR